MPTLNVSALKKWFWTSSERNKLIFCIVKNSSILFVLEQSFEELQTKIIWNRCSSDNIYKQNNIIQNYYAIIISNLEVFYRYHNLFVIEETIKETIYFLRYFYKHKIWEEKFSMIQASRAIMLNNSE